MGVPSHLSLIINSCLHLVSLAGGSILKPHEGGGSCATGEEQGNNMAALRAAGESSSGGVPVVTFGRRQLGLTWWHGLPCFGNVGLRRRRGAVELPVVACWGLAGRDEYEGKRRECWLWCSLSWLGRGAIRWWSLLACFHDGIGWRGRSWSGGWRGFVLPCVDNGVADDGGGRRRKEVVVVGSLGGRR